MGRGSSKGGGLGGGGEGLNPSDILGTKDMISNRDSNKEATDQVLSVARDLYDQYGQNGVLPGNFEIATLKPGARAMAYYDGSNIAINQAYFDSAKMNAAYDACVDSGFHPGRGNKSAIEAVTAHEFGHALADTVGQKMGGKNLHAASQAIVEEARQSLGNKKVKGFAGNISRYATESYAECVAEAISDVYCNGNKAKAESKAINKVVKKYLGQ